MCSRTDAHWNRCEVPGTWRGGWRRRMPYSLEQGMEGDMVFVHGRKLADWALCGEQQVRLRMLDAMARVVTPHDPVVNAFLYLTTPGPASPRSSWSGSPLTPSSASFSNWDRRSMRITGGGCSHWRKVGVMPSHPYCVGRRRSNLTYEGGPLYQRAPSIKEDRTRVYLPAYWGMELHCSMFRVWIACAAAA